MFQVATGMVVVSHPPSSSASFASAGLASSNVLARSRPLTSTTKKLKADPSPSLKPEASCDPLPPPVKILQATFAQTEQGKKFLNQETTFTFQKPTEKELEAFDTLAVRAIRDSDLNTLRKMLEEGKSFNACNKFGESLMHMACRRGNVEVVKFMIDEAHARVDVRDDYGRTPFTDACWTAKPNFDVMDVLLRAASPQLLLVEDIRGHTPFHYARREHWTEWANYLRLRAPLIISKLQG